MRVPFGLARPVPHATPLAALLALAACAAQPPADAAGGGAAVVPPPSLPAAPPAEATVPLESLLHVRTADLRRRFGDPHAQRRDGGAIVWNYEAEGACRLNLVLQGVRGSAAEVVHAQARMSPGATEESCFERLRQEARTSPVPVIETVAVAPAPRATARPASSPPKPPAPKTQTPNTQAPKRDR